jgi:serine/threonine protein phosphatase PrpC
VECSQEQEGNLYKELDSMLEEFKGLYAISRAVRVAMWLGTGCAAIFFFWVGGIPPLPWFQLAQALSRLPRLWGTQGAMALFPVVALTIASIAWLLAWLLLGYVVLFLVRLQRQRSYYYKQYYDGKRWALVRSLSENPSQSLTVAGDDIMTQTGFMPSRLHLPQRLQQPAQLTQPSLVPAGARAVHDIPTRPASDAPISRPLTPPPASPRPRLIQPLEVGVGWNTGITRQRNPNEDSLVVLQGTCTFHGRLVPFGLFVVADGMGGHAYGQEASRIAIQSMMQMVLQNIVTSNDINDEYLVEMLVGGVEWANQAIYQRGSEWGQEMGTTLTAALVVGTKAYIVNVGDSRTYLYRPSIGLTPITRDHSLVASLVASGEITPNEVYTHPERNKVYRSLGNKEVIEVDWFMVDLCENDSLLLCSDGLWEMVRDPEIERIIRTMRDPLRVSDVLVNAALQGGGRDNVSVVVARMP